MCSVNLGSRFAKWYWYIRSGRTRLCIHPNCLSIEKPSAACLLHCSGVRAPLLWSQAGREATGESPAQQLPSTSGSLSWTKHSFLWLQPSLPGTVGWDCLSFIIRFTMFITCGQCILFWRFHFFLSGLKPFLSVVTHPNYLLPLWLGLRFAPCVFLHLPNFPVKYIYFFSFYSKVLPALLVRSLSLQLGAISGTSYIYVPKYKNPPFIMHSCQPCPLLSSQSVSAGRSQNPLPHSPPLWIAGLSPGTRQREGKGSLGAFSVALL